MFDKIWDSHVVEHNEGEPALIYIDLHLVHEVTSPQAFEGLRNADRKVRRPDLTIATAQAMLDAGYHFDGAFLYDDMGYRNGTLFSPTSTVAWRSPRTRRRSASSGTGACWSSCTPAAA